MMKNHYAASVTLAALILVFQNDAVGQPPAAAAGAAVEQQAERVQRQAERAQRQAERARQQADRVQDQAAERAQRQAQRARSQAEERARNRVDMGRGVPASLPEQAAEQARANAQRGLDRAARAPGNDGDLPERLAVPGRNGEPAFVEISIEPGIRVLEREWVMMLTASQREQLESEAPQLMRFLTDTRSFNALDSQLLKFRVPPDLDTDEAIRDLLPEPLRDRIDRNHVYSAPAGAEQQEHRNSGLADNAGLLALPMASVCTEEVAVGLIDSAIRTDHRAFSGGQHQESARLISRDFLDAGLEAPMGHGTAVAGILVGAGPELNPLLPNATLYSASAFYSRDGDQQGASVMVLLEALDWLIARDASVINMSLTGPQNRLLEQGIQAAMAAGKVIVAAAGNNGPHAPARYPAAYDGVVAVSAVGRDRTVYRWANQGAHIDFTALGVAVPTALGDGGFGQESGTSMAAPVVSAFMACSLTRHGHSEKQTLSELKALAVDLGRQGHDPVFGHGLLHPALHPAQQPSSE